jgi:hypothetical protein
MDIIKNEIINQLKGLSIEKIVSCGCRTGGNYVEIARAECDKESVSSAVQKTIVAISDELTECVVNVLVGGKNIRFRTFPVVGDVLTYSVEVDDSLLSLRVFDSDDVAVEVSKGLKSVWLRVIPLCDASVCISRFLSINVFK